VLLTRSYLRVWVYTCMACVASKLTVGRRLGACILRAKGQLLSQSLTGSAREVATYSIKPAEPAISDIFGSDVHASVRSSTSAVASRLYQQETIQLDYGTPLTMDSAKEGSEQVNAASSGASECPLVALLSCQG
jgi:hypothetical protein